MWIRAACWKFTVETDVFKNNLIYFCRTVLFAIVLKKEKNRWIASVRIHVELLLLFLYNRHWCSVVCTTTYSFWKQQSSHSPRICVVVMHCLFVYMHIIVTVHFVFLYWEGCVFFLNHTFISHKAKKFGLSQKKFFAFLLHAWSLISNNTRSKWLFVLLPSFMHPLYSSMIKQRVARWRCTRNLSKPAIQNIHHLQTTASPCHLRYIRNQLFMEHSQEVFNLLFKSS